MLTPRIQPEHNVLNVIIKNFIHPYKFNTYCFTIKFKKGLTPSLVSIVSLSLAWSFLEQLELPKTNLGTDHWCYK